MSALRFLVSTIVCTLILLSLACSSSSTRDAYIGTWAKISGGGEMTITDNGRNLMIHDDHDQTFTGTIDENGDLQTSMMAKMSIDKSNGHLVWVNGEYQRVKSLPQPKK